MQRYWDKFQTHFEQDVSKFDFGFTTHPIDQDALWILEPFSACHIKDLLQVLENILKVTREHLMVRSLASATGFDICKCLCCIGGPLPHSIRGKPVVFSRDVNHCRENCRLRSFRQWCIRIGLDSLLGFQVLGSRLLLDKELGLPNADPLQTIGFIRCA